MTRIAFLASTALVCGTLAAQAQTAVNGEGSSLAAPTYKAEFTTYNGLGNGYNFSFYSTSSGKGFAALVANSGTAGSGVPSGTAVDFAGTDFFVTAAQVSQYNTANSSVTGPLIQVPALGVAVAIPFKNPKYTGHTDGSGIKLTDNDLCGVFSGKLTSWNQLSTGGQGGATTAIQVAYRSDSSGTTFLLTQHLKYVCNSTNSNFTSTDLNTTMPTTSFTSLSTTSSLVNALPASGSGGVAAALNTATSAIGYLSPDFTAVAKNPAVNYGLQAASVLSPNGTYYQPTYQNTATALTASQKNAKNTSAPSTAALAKVQTNWVPQLPQPQAGYPIVGYTNLQLATCYQNGKAAGLVDFLTKQYATSNNIFTQTVNNNGFVILSNASYITAINKYILSNTGGANVDIGDATTCSGKTGR